jgi:heme exporter protein D
MTMSEFFHAGGYGFYLWSSFAITAVLMIGEPLLLKQNRKSVIKRLKRLIRLEQA